MKKAIFILFSVCLIIISCKKDKTDPVAANNNPYANSNDGSNWIYEVKTQNPAGDTTTNNDTSRVTSPDTTIGAKSYYRIIHNDGTHAYFNVSGNEYYQFQHVVLPSILDTSIEVLYLKDNAANGTSWSQNLTVSLFSVPLPITFTSTITGTGLTKTVNGVTYNDVVRVGTVLTAPGLTITSDIQNYYARNIGLIQGDYNIDISGGLGSIHTQTLIKFADPH